MTGSSIYPSLCNQSDNDDPQEYEPGSWAPRYIWARECLPTFPPSITSSHKRKMDSKSLPPCTDSFFPTIFYKTQFCERQAGLPPGLNLSQQVAIVTGANAGLGFESAKQLLALKLSHLILAVRSVERGEKAAEKLRQEWPYVQIQVWELDMCSYKSITAFATRVHEQLSRLDIALLNAGLVTPEFRKVEETGHEETMQVVRSSMIIRNMIGAPLTLLRRTISRLCC